MPSGSFATILPWILSNDYLMIFAAIIIGGPIFISAAAFVAALGYLNVYIIFSLAFFGEMAVDWALYLFGYVSRVSVVKKFGHYLGLTDERILKLEKLLGNHPWKTLLIIKYSPFIPFPGFVITGAAKLPFRRFFYILLVLSLLKAVFFTAVGYFFGQVYNKLSEYFYYGQYFIVAAVILFIGANYLLVWISKKIFNNGI